MADVTQTLALIVLAQEFRGDIVRQINRRSITLRTLRIVQGGGKNLALVAQGDGAIAEEYNDGADAANFGSDEQDPAIWAWGLHRGLFHTSTLARDAASSAYQPEGLRDLIGRGIVDATMKVTDLINNKLYTGSGSGNRIAGFDVAIGDDTNTYASIDRTSNAYWRPYVVDPGVSTPLTLAQIRKDLAAIYIASGERPDVAYCSPDVHNTVASLFDNNRRHIQNSVTTARGVIQLDAGYEVVLVNNCQFLEDKDAPANTIYYVNSNFVEVQYLPPDPRIVAELRGMGMELVANDGYGSIPLGMRIEKLAKTGASDKYQLLATCALAVRRPNSCGVRKNVAIVS